MITATRPYTVQNRQQQQNVKFGNFWTASKARDDIWKGLLGKTITSTEAYQKVEEKMVEEDKIGKKVLEGFKQQLDAWYKPVQK